MISIRIWHEVLFVCGDNDELPLSLLDLDENSHIHGGLRIQFGDRLLPHMGFFGPNDVCFNTWVEELWGVAQAFQCSPTGKHVFDEGEQGQPTYVFERRGSRAFITIADSKISGGNADPDWQEIEFSPDDFLIEYKLWRESFLATVRSQAPNTAEEWIRRNVPEDSKA